MIATSKIENARAGCGLREVSGPVALSPIISSSPHRITTVSPFTFHLPPFAFGVSIVKVLTPPGRVPDRRVLAAGGRMRKGGTGKLGSPEERGFPRIRRMRRMKRIGRISRIETSAFGKTL